MVENDYVRFKDIAEATNYDYNQNHRCDVAQDLKHLLKLGIIVKNVNKKKKESHYRLNQSLYNDILIFSETLKTKYKWEK